VIAIDTNVIVRVIVADDARQTAAAVRLLQRAVADGACLFVSTVVLCETVWVLRSTYKFPSREVSHAISELLVAAHLHIEDRAAAERALAAFDSGRGDFPDYLIREAAIAAGAEAVATFDRALSGETAFIHPDPDTWDDGVTLREDAPAYGRRRRTMRRAPRRRVTV
jgi:predicted nucleic-acid-binding protein